MKVKVADCAPGYAKMTAAAEWFVQDDMPTIYYISVSDETGNIWDGFARIEKYGDEQFVLCFVCTK